MFNNEPQPPPPEPNASRSHAPHTNATETAPDRKREISSSQRTLATILIVTLIGSVLGHFALDSNFENTGIYFVVIPGTMSILLSLIPTAANRTNIGVIQGSMIAVFASAFVLREGFICVLMASPLILLIAILVDQSNKKRHTGRHAALLLPLLLLGASGEGIVYELPTNVTVEETRTVDITSEALVNSLAQPAQLPAIEPLLFALPFPLPERFEGEGLDVGDTRTVDFGDMGSIDLAITEVAANAVTWTFVDNSTPLNDWMTIHSATASWVETPDGLDITMAIEFDRELAPAFYFDPLERWGVGELAEVLLDMIENNAAAGTNTDANENVATGA